MKVLLVLSDTRLTEYQLAAIVVMKFLVLESTWDHIDMCFCTGKSSQVTFWKAAVSPFLHQFAERLINLWNNQSTLPESMATLPLIICSKTHVNTFRNALKRLIVAYKSNFDLQVYKYEQD